MGSFNSSQVQFDPETDDVVDVIVRSVGAVLDQEPVELTPLGSTVDTELLQHAVDASASSSIHDARIAFQWNGVDVRLNVNGEVSINWEEVN